MITLHNVIDIRTNKFHSEVIVSARKAKYFISAEKEQEAEDGDII